MKRSHGSHSKHSRNLRSKGAVPITKYLREFKIGQTVRIDVDPSKYRGRISTLRFNHKLVRVLGRQGRGYKLELMDGGKRKLLIVTNAHISPVGA